MQKHGWLHFNLSRSTSRKIARQLEVKPTTTLLETRRDRLKLRFIRLTGSIAICPSLVYPPHPLGPLSPTLVILNARPLSANNNYDSPFSARRLELPPRLLATEPPRYSIAQSLAPSHDKSNAIALCNRNALLPALAYLLLPLTTQPTTWTSPPTTSMCLRLD